MNLIDEIRKLKEDQQFILAARILMANSGGRGSVEKLVFEIKGRTLTVYTSIEHDLFEEYVDKFFVEHNSGFQGEANVFN